VTGSGIGASEPAIGASDDPLAFLVAPVPPEAFLERHYERAPLVSAGSDPGRFASLLSLEMVDRFIDTADLRQDMVALVRSGRIVDAARYVAPSGRVIPSAVVEEYLGGATIILQHLQDSLRSLGEFCGALEARFSAHTQTNVYLTPPGAQGFAPHHDTHDVFVLQISGTKKWRLYESQQLPPRGLELRPGDCLYIPRGLTHDASSTEEASLHVTVGVIGKSWHDLLAAALAALGRRDAELGRLLPLGHAGPAVDRQAIRRGFLVAAERLADPRLADEALDMLIDDFLRDRRPKVGGVLAIPAREAASRPHRLRPLTPWRLRSEGRDLILTGPGGDLRFDSAQEEALHLALSGTVFEPLRLPCPDPQRLFHKLWSNGYLVPATA